MYASKPLQLRYTGIFVSDVAATVSFYERAFGLNLRYLHPSGGYAEMETGDTLLCFVGEEFLDDTKLLGYRNLHANRRQAPASGAQIAFVSHNLSADWNRALQAGAEVVCAPEAKPWGQIVGYLNDLNGFIVEICTPSPRA
jgi:lactoylglutathione lyase